MTTDNALIISQTRKWITDVVVGCNFCPFAAREVRRDAILYQVLHAPDAADCMEGTLAILQQMDEQPDIETALLILPGSFEEFEDYLDLVATAEALIEENEYEGIYQVASFHPNYLFAGEADGSPGNYTNRSPYPMLHFLREESVSRAVDSHPDISAIPANNIRYSNEKGLAYMQMLLAKSMEAE